MQAGETVRTGEIGEGGKGGSKKKNESRSRGKMAREGSSRVGRRKGRRGGGCRLVSM